MREKTQHSNFSKSICLFLIVPLILISSFSFPRPARAAILIAIIVVVDYFSCDINIIWGCNGGDGGGGGGGTVASCVATTISNCSLPETASSGSAGSCSSGYSGSCDYTCSNGTWTENSNKCIGIPTATFSASPGTIDSGQSSTLTWNSAFSTSCTAAGGFSTGGATSGSVSTGALIETSTFQITCTGDGGTSAPASATVTVLDPSVTISAAPDRVASGGQITISWDATNINACTITKNGTTWQTLTSGPSRTLSGSATDTITTQTTYVITCTNNTSSTAIAATAKKIVNVVPIFDEF